MDDRELDAALDDLFSQPPEDFVGARGALSRRLKSAGRKEDAARIGAWRRPTRTVWALNRLALTARDAVDALGEAAAAVREQSSGGSGMREAMADLRQATRHAADTAVAAIAPSRPSDHADVSAALLAVLADTEALALLGDGRLLEVPEAGFGAFGATPTAPAGSRPPPRAKAAPKRSKSTAKTSDADRDEDAARRKELQAALAEARKARKDAERVQQRAEAAVESADRQVQRAQERAERARTELDEAEAALEGAETTAREARSAAEAAATELTDAEAILAEREEAAAD